MALFVRLIYLIGSSLSRFKGFSLGRLRSILTPKLTVPAQQVVKGLTPSNFVSRMLALAREHKISTAILIVSILAAFDSPSDAAKAIDAAKKADLADENGNTLPAVVNEDQKVGELIAVVDELNQLSQEDKKSLASLIAEKLSWIPGVESHSEKLAAARHKLGSVADGATMFKAVRASEKKWEELASCLGRNQKTTVRFITLMRDLTAFDFEVANEF